MPYLAITGVSRWIAVESPSKMRVYEPGVHEVDEATAALARAPGTPKRIYVSDTPLEVVEPPPGQPLTLEDIRVGTAHVRLAPSDEHEPEPEQVETPAVPSTHFCDYCPAQFPSAPPLARHIKRHHMLHQPDPELEPEPDPEPDPEVAARLANARPDELHPAERELLDGWPA